MIPGAPLLNVAARLLVTTIPPTILPVLVDNASGQGLRLDWTVSKARSSDPDSATIAVYNLMTTARAQLAAAMAIPSVITRAMLFVGWGGISELVFGGDVMALRAADVEGTDIVTRFEARAGGRSIRDTPPSGSSAYGIQMHLAVSALLGQMQLPPSPAALATIVAAATAKAPVAAMLQHVNLDEPRQALDLLMASVGLGWDVDAAGFFVVYVGGLRNDVLPAVLCPMSGLLQWSVVDDGGVQFEALAQATCVPGQQVTVLDELNVPVGGGPLRVERVEFVGSTTGESIMRGTARKLVPL